MTENAAPVRNQSEKEAIWRNWKAGIKLMREGRTLEGYTRMLESFPVVTSSDLEWLQEENRRHLRVLDVISAWGDPKRDKNKTLRDIVLREAERGNAEAQAMLGSWHTMMPFC
jgi:hypothetical protein